MTTRLQKVTDNTTPGYMRYTVHIDGHYAGWVSKFDDEKEWTAHVTADLAGWGGARGLEVARETLRRDAVLEIEVYYGSHGWVFAQEGA